jgi:DNA/RNA endonuclease YhcR with UshA esterase domain
MKRILNVRALIVMGFALACANVASAHHSYAAFDTTKEITVKGTVKVFKFENPHVNIVVTVTDPKDGKATDWFFEAASVRGLVIQGWRKSTLKEGDVVTLTGHPIRDGRPGASLMRAQLADGTILQANALAIQNY